MAKRKTPEDTLSERVKMALEAALSKQGGRVYDYCGPVEYGLDLVVCNNDIFGQLRCYGIQIKTGNISCSGRPNQKIKEIIGQLAIAFGKEIPVNGPSYRLDGFYVITDGDINEFANNYIKSASVGIRNLHFIDGCSLNKFLQFAEAEAKTFEQT